LRRVLSHRRTQGKRFLQLAIWGEHEKGTVGIVRRTEESIVWAWVVVFGNGGGSREFNTIEFAGPSQTALSRFNLVCGWDSVPQNSPRLRAREDGEIPSPPRDCKAKFLPASRQAFGTATVDRSKLGVKREGPTAASIR
jgi:hypothetical protein